MGIEIEGVVHRPRRMVGRDVERLKIAEIVFNFRAFSDRETDPREQRLNSRQRTTQWMIAAGLLAAPRQRHVDGLGGQASV